MPSPVQRSGLPAPTPKPRKSPPGRTPKSAIDAALGDPHDTKISEALWAALQLLAAGHSREAAAQQAGIPLKKIELKLRTTHGLEAMRTARRLCRDGVRDRLWAELVKMTGVVDGVAGAADDKVRLTALTTALGILGDSQQAATTTIKAELDAVAPAWPEGPRPTLLMVVPAGQETHSGPLVRIEHAPVADEPKR